MKYLTQTPLFGRTPPTTRSRVTLALLAMGAIGISAPAGAVLTSEKMLTIVRATVGADVTVRPANGAGSWFSMLAMDTDSDAIPDANIYTGIAGKNGIKLGTIQPASGSHTGAPNCTPGVGACNRVAEYPNIDKPWGFFGNTGMHYTTLATNILTATGATATANFSGWTVHWNGDSIPMTGGAWELGFVNGVAKVTCAAVCAEGETYTLDYSATVPSGGFTGVQYHLHLEGMVVTILASDDTTITTMNNPVAIDVLGNDAAVAGINPASVAIVSAPSQGTASINTTTGFITYTPPTNVSGAMTFTYTFRDLASTISNTATVTVNVRVNTAPTAVADSVSVTSGTSIVIPVLDNDTDPDGDTTLGNIDPTTVTITQQPASGSATINLTTGAITYASVQGFTGPVTILYTVRDRDGATSGTGTVNISVEAYPGDFTNAPAAGEVPILFLESGSYFTMEVSAGNPVRTNLFAGADQGIIINQEQYAGGSHTGAPNGTTEVTGIDQPWSFFSNTGMHYSSNGGIVVNTAGTPGDGTRGTLNFSNRWFVTWNGIPAINMGGSAQDDAAVVGKASISCNPRPCADGSTYTLNYTAHVPLGDPSGFGGVPYGLHMVGHVRYINTTLAASSGTVAQGSLGLGTRITEAQLPAADSFAGSHCVGGCFDFQVSSVVGARVQVVLPLTSGIRLNSVYRKYSSGTWRDFDTSNGDSVKSAPFVAGTATCPAANNAAYTAGLTVGNYCVQLDIADNGPNDTNPAGGTVADPGGVAAAAAVAPPDNRITGSSGCSLNANPVNPLERGDWWLLLGFVAWLGFVIRRKRA